MRTPFRARDRNNGGRETIVSGSGEDVRSALDGGASEALREASALAAIVRGPELRVVAASAPIDALAGGRAAGRTLGELAPPFAAAVSGAAAAALASGEARLADPVPRPGRPSPADHAALCVPVRAGGAQALLVVAAPSGGDAARAPADLAAALSAGLAALEPGELGPAAARGVRAILDALAVLVAKRDPEGGLVLIGAEGVHGLDLSASDAGAPPPVRHVRLGGAAPRAVTWSPDPVWLEQRAGAIAARYPVHPARPGSRVAAQWALVPLAHERGVGLLGVALPDGESSADTRVLEAIGREIARALASIPGTPAAAAEPAAREPSETGPPPPAEAAQPPAPLRPRPPPLPTPIAAPGERLVAMIAHDLRTPLSAIEQATTLLLHGGRVGEADAALLRRIARNAHRIGVLADELLDLARVRQTGGVPVQPRAVDLRDVVERAVRDVQDAFPGRAVAVAAAGPCPGEWDPARLEQVVSNLVQNALEHSPSGAAISVAIACSDPTTARIEVRNAAGAIAPELLPRIFEPFEAGPRSRGAGLGLFIVREIVRAHGGEVRVRSAEGEGTTFTVELPRSARRE